MDGLPFPMLVFRFGLCLCSILIWARLFFLSGIASALDGGKGRIKEAMEATKDG